MKNTKRKATSSLVPGPLVPRITRYTIKISKAPPFGQRAIKPKKWLIKIAIIIEFYRFGPLRPPVLQLESAYERQTAFTFH